MSIDALGSGLWEDVEGSSEQSGVGANQHVWTVAPEEGELIYIQAAAGHHTDGANPHELSIGITGPFGLALMSPISVASGVQVAMPRPIILPYMDASNWRLRVLSVDSVAAASRILIAVQYIRLPMGSYVWSPG